MITLGLDPGLNGGFAIVDDGRLVACGELPTAGDGTKRMISGPLFASIFKVHPHVDQCVIERVGARPGEGVVSSFRFGRSLGIVEGVIAGRGIPILWVAPGVWKRSYGLGQDKDASRQRAIERWPHTASLYFGRKKDHGRAEAALIALWGARAAQAAGEAA
jgi:crossover junction endodeoxyribonuclease RuvC